MSRPYAIAFQSTRKALIEETRLKTLELYKSLLRSSEKFQHADVLQQVIRHKFKKNKYNTSRSKVLQLLTEADKTKQLLAKEENRCYVQDRINAYTLQHPIKTTKPKETIKKKPAQTKRKPYQVAIVTQSSGGCEFKRVRGWVQPLQTSMMIKKRVETKQKRLDKIDKLQAELEMIQSERMFLDTLGCLPSDKLSGFETTIKSALDLINSYHYKSFSNQK